MLKFRARIKICRNHYTAHTCTIVPVARRDNSCVWNDNSALHKSGIYNQDGFILNFVNCLSQVCTVTYIGS